ncbi:MAG: 4-hydroxybenzoate octaprenyltransferase [bacterium]|nr:4-hydroxybenzoate octaprenyltransferase [bacterium]
MSAFERLKNYLGLVRFSHTVFALPFAFMSAFTAAGGALPLDVAGWILLCMVGARTSAMTFNRLVDARIDAQNPRTRDRHIPAGKVSRMEAMGLFLVSVAAFFYGAWRLNPLAFALAPAALLIVCGYSFFKRFSALCHLVLGLALGVAPIGAWIAVRGRFDAPPLILAAGVLLWVAGFDVIYALLDEEFDRKMGLHSLVVALGRLGALRAAFLLHAGSIAFIFAFGASAGLGWVYNAGAACFAALIVFEHFYVRPDDVGRINIAFFNVNGAISIGLFCFTLLDLVLIH